MCGWLATETALPMSWHSEATTISSSAPASSARVAVCREWVSWSTAKPSVISERDCKHGEHPIGHPGLVLEVSATMVCHCSRWTRPSRRSALVARTPGGASPSRRWPSASWSHSRTIRPPPFGNRAGVRFRPAGPHGEWGRASPTRPGGSQEARSSRTSAAETSRSLGHRVRLTGGPGAVDQTPRAVARARSSSRSSGGGGKYSSSVVTAHHLDPAERGPERR